MEKSGTSLRIDMIRYVFDEIEMQIIYREFMRNTSILVNKASVKPLRIEQWFIVTLHDALVS